MVDGVFGRQFAIELYGCDTARLDDLAFIEGAMLEAAVACGATVVTHKFHRFSPQGVSGVVVIAESHLAIHTWPEHGYAAVDLFTCGDKVQPAKAIAYLRGALGAGESEVTEIARGRGVKR